MAHQLLPKVDTVITLYHQRIEEKNSTIFHTYLNLYQKKNLVVNFNKIKESPTQK